MNGVVNFTHICKAIDTTICAIITGRWTTWGRCGARDKTRCVPTPLVNSINKACTRWLLRWKTRARWLPRRPTFLRALSNVPLHPKTSTSLPPLPPHSDPVLIPPAQSLRPLLSPPRPLGIILARLMPTLFHPLEWIPSIQTLTFSSYTPPSRLFLAQSCIQMALHINSWLTIPNGFSTPMIFSLNTTPILMRYLILPILNLLEAGVPRRRKTSRTGELRDGPREKNLGFGVHSAEGRMPE